MLVLILNILTLRQLLKNLMTFKLNYFDHWLFSGCINYIFRRLRSLHLGWHIVTSYRNNYRRCGDSKWQTAWQKIHMKLNYTNQFSLKSYKTFALKWHQTCLTEYKTWNNRAREWGCFCRGPLVFQTKVITFK